MFSIRPISNNTDFAVTYVIDDINNATTGFEGMFLFDASTSILYVYQNGIWTSISSANIISPALQSIANLVTSGNEMIYTIASNTYATSSITPSGRSFLAAGSQASQRAAIGAVIGIDVQAHSNTLDSIVTISNSQVDQIIYTTGSGVSNTLLTPYVRTNILNAVNNNSLLTSLGLDYLPLSPNGGFNLSSDIVVGLNSTQILSNKIISSANNNTLILGSNSFFQGLPFSAAGSTINGNILTVVGGTLQLTPPTGGGNVTGPGFSTINAIPRFANNVGTLLANSGILIDNSNNITGIANINSSGIITATSFSGTLTTSSQPNITSVGTLTSLTVSGISTFNGLINANNSILVPSTKSITLTDQPISGTDAANKDYVDNAVINTGIQYTSADAATISVLPNTPTYNAASGTLTSTGPATSLTIDGVSFTANDGKRVLIKDQVDSRQNGIYTRTTGVDWVLTRTTDADIPSELTKNNSIFVTGGTTNTNTGWKLQNTVTQLNPLVGATPIVWLQYSGSQNIQAGNGMTQTGNTFNVNGTTNRITVGATSVDISSSYIGQTSINTLGTITTGIWNGSVVSPTYGGTGLSNPTTNNVLITAGSGAMTLKSNPSGAFVGTTDTQTLTNKILSTSRINTSNTVFANSDITSNTLSIDTSSLTSVRSLIVPDTNDTFTVNNFSQSLTNKTLTNNTNNILARGLWTNTGSNSVSTYNASNPISGQVLTATSATTATWQTPSTSGFSPDRTIFVYQGAPNVFPNYSLLSGASGAINAAIALTPTASNQVLIQIYPGRYSESIPMTIPAFVTISSTVVTQADVIIRPSVPAPISPMFILNGDTRLEGFVIECSDGAGTPAYATYGIQSIGSVGKIDYIIGITVKNASVSCFYVNGSNNKLGQILICKSCSAQVTVVGFTVGSGYEVTGGGYLNGTDLNATGFFISGFSGMMTNGFYIHDTYSFMDVNNIQSSICSNGVRVGSGTSSNSKADYPIFRCTTCNLNQISVNGLFMEEKSVVVVNGLIMADNTGLYPNQAHIRVNSPALPADPNELSSLGTIIRSDRISYDGSGALNNLPIVSGFFLTNVPGDNRNTFKSDLTVGSIGRGSTLSSGEGPNYLLGINVIQDNGGVFSDVTSRSIPTILNPISVNVATTTQINLSSAPATIDGIAPTSGVTRVLVKDGSTANPNISGASVDNGIYLWNGTGNVMTRTADFAAGSTRFFQTWFMVDVGTVNYGTAWEINPATLVNTESITVGTTSFGLLSQSIPLFGGNVVNNALYIGTQTLIKFYGVQLGMIKPIVLSSGATPSALVWEYWNGSSWTSMSFMVNSLNIPYINDANISFAQGDTIINPNIIFYDTRFGNISTTWATTTVNSILAYWIRIRCTNAIITTIPTFTSVKVHSNHSEIMGNGTIMYYGTGRPIISENIDLTSLTSTGTSGETALTNTRLVATSTIAGNLLTTFIKSATLSATGSFRWNPSTYLDTSANIILKMAWSRDNGGSGTNIALEVQYAFVSPNDIIGNPNGGLTATTQTTGIIAYPISGTNRGAFNININLNVVGLNVNTQYLWIKVARVGPNVLDTYTNSVYLLSMKMSYVTWANGEYYSS